jgi:hypothetical protein
MSGVVITASGEKIPVGEQLKLEQKAIRPPSGAKAAPAADGDEP